MGSRLELFRTCNPKNIDIEAVLTNNIPQITIGVTEGNVIRLPPPGGRLRHPLLISANSIKPGEVRILNIQEGHLGAHSVILSKSHEFPNEWALFDPNGIKNLPFKILDSQKNNVTKEYLTPSPLSPLNYGVNAYNPGYCGIFGIIYMIFFLNNFSDPNWLQEWKKTLVCLSQKISNHHGSVGVNLAAQVQALIANPELSNARNPVSVPLQHGILQLIKNFSICDAVKDNERRRDSTPDRRRSRSPRRSTGGKFSRKKSRKLSKKKRHKSRKLKN